MPRGARCARALPGLQPLGPTRADASGCVLPHRKEKRHHGISRLLKNLEFEAEMAAETLDDDKEQYERDAKVWVGVRDRGGSG